jgi:hypothetical protein
MALAMHEYPYNRICQDECSMLDENGKSNKQCATTDSVFEKSSEIRFQRATSAYFVHNSVERK